MRHVDEEHEGSPGSTLATSPFTDYRRWRAALRVPRPGRAL